MFSIFSNFTVNNANKYLLKSVESYKGYLD